MRYVELRRHTDNEGDRLTPQGAADAEMIGRDRLHPPYAALVSTGAARATQMLEILRHAAGQADTPITAATGLRSPAEDRWRDAAKAAGKGADLDAIRVVDPELVERESVLLASALRQVVDRLPEGGRALVVGHSPTSEAAVLGLAGRIIPPLGKGEGVLLIEDRGDLPGRAAGLNSGERLPPGARCRGTESARVAGVADRPAGQLLPRRNGIWYRPRALRARCDGGRQAPVTEGEYQAGTTVSADRPTMRCGLVASSSQLSGAEQPVLVPLLRRSSSA